MGKTLNQIKANQTIKLQEYTLQCDLCISRQPFCKCMSRETDISLSVMLVFAEIYEINSGREILLSVKRLMFINYSFYF